MLITIFRSRLRPGIEEEYGERATRMLELAQTMPGFRDIRDYEGPDGERVAIVEFESVETQRAWAEHPEHRVAQKLGRERYYSEYSIQVCEADDARTWRFER